MNAIQEQRIEQRGHIKELVCCRSFRANLSALIDGELDVQEQCAYEVHAASCDVCQKLMDQTVRLVKSAAELGERPLPEKVAQRLRKRLEQEGFRSDRSSKIIPLIRR